MCNKLGWKKKYPFTAKIPHHYQEPSAWLRTQFGHESVTLSSGRKLAVNRKEGVWAFEKMDYTGTTYRFGTGQDATLFLLRWS
jgi:hypothetical protein